MISLFLKKVRQVIGMSSNNFAKQLIKFSDSIREGLDAGLRYTDDCIVDDMFKPRRVEVVETGERFDSIRSCARHFNTEPSNVRNCLKYSKRTLYGFHLRAVDDYED